jgi:hypothetical protein
VDQRYGGDVINGDVGHFPTPALFLGASSDMRVAGEEIFGPTATVIEPSDFEGAVAIANDTGFGLASGICTTSLLHAREFIDRTDQRACSRCGAHDRTQALEDLPVDCRRLYRDGESRALECCPRSEIACADPRQSEESASNELTLEVRDRPVPGQKISNSKVSSSAVALWRSLLGISTISPAPTTTSSSCASPKRKRSASTGRRLPRHVHLGGA